MIDAVLDAGLVAHVAIVDEGQPYPVPMRSMNPVVRLCRSTADGSSGDAVSSRSMSSRTG